MITAIDNIRWIPNHLPKTQTDALSDESSAKQRANSSHSTRNALAEIHIHGNEIYRGKID